MAVVGFWVIPVFLAVRGLYFGIRDGFLAHVLLKIWAVFWTLWLAEWLIAYSKTHVSAGNACGRETTFTALWLTSFALIHGAAVYIVRRFELMEKIYDKLNEKDWYLRWRRVDLIAGGVVQAVAALGVSYYMAAPLYNPPEGTPLWLVGRAANAVGSKVTSFLGLHGPDYFGIGGYQENFLQHSSATVNGCMQLTPHEPYGWLLYVWAFAIGPLFAIICLQPVLYLSIWIKRLGRGSGLYVRSDLACRKCGGRGIHVRNPLLFGTLCIDCRGSGHSKFPSSLGSAEAEEHEEDPEEIKVNLSLILKTYIWFWILILLVIPALMASIALLIVVMVLIVKIALWLL
jgi:hypothetical protein